MNTLFVDDSTDRWQQYSEIAKNLGWFAGWAINYNAAQSGFSYKTYDIVFLDHDLGENEKSGYDVAKFMVEHGIKVGLVVIHTMNPVGADNIHTLLRNTGYKTIRGPWNDENFIKNLKVLITGP